MKTLLLMRHAKSDWKASFSHDHERPLARRGVAAAKLMGRLLALAHETPDSVITSTAVRAQETIRLAASGWDCPIRSTDRLYNTRLDTVLEEVFVEPNTTSRLMIVGHEPTWSLLLSEMVGGGRHSLAAGAVARIDVPAETWGGVETGTGELRWLLTPRLMTDVLPPED